MSSRNATLEGSCFSCNAVDAEFACSRCRRVHFCNAKCQRAGWRRHKADCSAQVGPLCLTVRPAAPLPQSEDGPVAAHTGKPRPTPDTNLAAVLLQAMAGGCQKPLRFTAYPNVGALQGEVEVQLPTGADWHDVRKAVARCVLGGADPSRVCLFEAGGGGKELASLEELRSKASQGIGVVVSGGQPQRPGGGGQLGGDAHVDAAGAARRRYNVALAGGPVLRVGAADPELQSLLRCPVPVVVEGSGLLGQAPERWSFDYLDRCLSDVDSFYVLCAPAQSRGRFAYYDMRGAKNPCGYEVAMTNERLSMRFPDFRQKVAEARKRRRAGKKYGSFYLQNTLLHREESEPGPPKPVGGFGVTCAVNIAKDIRDFDWEWLKRMMGDRHPQMCQFFCGVEGGFSPCHYDPQDNLFAQVRGYKRVLLFHPRHFGCLYPWPVHHPQDRQSRVDFDRPDLSAFPRFRELRGLGLEAVLGPGDALRIPPGWWHHVEMLPSSPDGEVVSINFWYPPPPWFYGDLAAGDIFWDRPLFGVRRVLFQRCVEELAAQVGDPADVQEVILICTGARPPALAGSRSHQAVESVLTFVSTVFADSAERAALLNEIIDGRFLGLVSKKGA